MFVSWQRCRLSSKVIKQLRVWSVELADEADAADRQTAENREGAEGNYGSLPLTEPCRAAAGRSSATLSGLP